MQKVIITLYLILFSSIFTTLNAKIATWLPPPVPSQINNSENGGVGGDAGTKCNYHQWYIIQVANLDLLNGVECEPFLQTLSLPEDYPAIVIHIKINGVLIIEEQIESFEITNTCGEEDGDPAIYRHDIMISFDKRDFCQLPGRDITITAEILTPELEPYPICDYSGSDDLFPSDWFGESQLNCSADVGIIGGGSSDGSGNDDDSIEPYIVGETTCSGCSKYETPIAADASGEAIEGSSQEQGLSQIAVAIAPNPFSDKLLITWIDDANNTEIRLYDTSGKLVKTLAKSSYQKEEIIRWDTSTLPKGLYFLQIQNEQGSKYIKLIKS